MWLVDKDGYIRVRQQELANIHLEHLVSGISGEVAQVDVPSRSGTRVFGYTEWATTRIPAISIGWDWILDAPDASVPKRHGNPYSNIMVVDADGREVGIEKSASLLCDMADRLSWYPMVLEMVGAEFASG